MDASAACDERGQGGRRSCVGLISRRWYQRRDDAEASRGGRRHKARSPGRARRKPLKPLRRKRRMIRPCLWWLHSCAFYFCTRGYGRGRRPAFPAPSMPRGLLQNSGAWAPARMQPHIEMSLPT